MIRRLLLALVAACAPWAAAHEADFPTPLLAEGGGDGAGVSIRPRQAPGQELPLVPTRTVAFETDEGTWMSVDVSLDDRHIVFDLLGDLYSLPVSGGRAIAVTQGLGFDTQPTYSPDGQWVAFISDRSGSDNLWVMKLDGSQARQVSFGSDDTVLVSPAWTPDGKSLYVSRFRWSLNNYELWRYELDGAETLIVPIKTQEQPAAISSLGAVVSPDGRYVYFARRRGEPAEGHWTIVRRDVASGEEETLVPDTPGPGRPSDAGKHFRPLLSPDGRWLAYASRYRGETGLRLRELASGKDRWIAYPIARDQVDAQSWQDLVPRYAFTRDGQSLILSRNGKFERLPVDAGSAVPIPFSANVRIELGPQTRVDVRQDVGPLRARLIQTPEEAPDGKTVAFSALGKIYTMALRAAAKPRRLTADDQMAFHPSWSPDGRNLVYITWTAKQGGQVWIMPASGGDPRLLSDSAAYYTRPVFTPDGQRVVAIRSNHRGRLETLMDYGDVREGELVEWPVAGSTPARVVYRGRLGGKPHFSAVSGAVFVQTSGLTQIDLSSGEAKPPVMILGPGWYFIDGPVPVDDARISPDGRYVLVLVAQQLHLLAMPATGTPVDLSKPGLAHRRITDVGADFFEWADGGKSITWSVGSTFQRRPLSDIKLNNAEHPNWTADAPRIRKGENTFDAVVQLPRDTPRGSIVLRGARVVTMRGDEVIENADVLVRDDRIAAVGARGSVKIPGDAVVQDLSGSTLVPGFIDIHDHLADIRRDVLSTDSWGASARLAYGITTAFDPSSLSIDMFAYQDLIDAGQITGSRISTTGMAMFSFNRLESPQDATALLTRHRDYYRTRNAKQYLIGDRRQRQWLVQSAARLGVMPTTEGTLSLKLDLTQIMDGFAGSEHALPTALYRDVIELVARSGTAYDGTLQIRNGGPPAQDQFIIRDQPLSNEKFLRTRPYLAAAASGQKREWIDPSISIYPRLGVDAANIQRAGGVVGMGSHGELPGVGFHWEMAAHVEGGMTPWEALRAGTLGSATAIGRSAEFGSIEVGKFADLVVLKSDPRADIRVTLDPLLVMKNGRLYDAATLDEIWPRRKPFEPSWYSDQRPVAR